MRARTVFSLSIALLWCVAGCGIEGLHNADPQTRLTVDPSTKEVKLWNNKDVDVSVDSVEYLGAQKDFKLTNLKFRDNASDVRNANVNQMMGMAYQAQVNWAGASNMVAQLTGLISEIMPFLPATIAAKANSKLSSITTPWGGISSGSIQDVSALMPKTTPTVEGPIGTPPGWVWDATAKKWSQISPQTSPAQ